MDLATTLYTSIKSICDFSPEGYANDHVLSHLAGVYASKSARNTAIDYADVLFHIDSNLTQHGFRREAVEAVAGLIFDTYTAVRSNYEVAA